MRPPDTVGRCADCPLRAALWEGRCWSCGTVARIAAMLEADQADTRLILEAGR